MLTLQRQARAASTAAPVELGLSLEKIRFLQAVKAKSTASAQRTCASSYYLNSKPTITPPAAAAQ